jgi:hypothetical protein
MRAHITEAQYQQMKERAISSDSVSGARRPKGAKVGEPYTRDAAMRNQSTEGQGNVKSGTRTQQTTIYRSKWEAAYANKLELEKRAGIIKAYWYEPFSLWLPGKVRYKPDFLIEQPYIPGMERHLEIVEVKGWSKNRRDGITRLKIAAALFPCFVWRLVYRTKGGGWGGEYV